MTVLKDSKILLKDENRCPRCYRASVRRDLNRCVLCNARLMWPDSNFAELQREVQKSYYVFFKGEGWMHSDHLDNPEPNSPIVNLKPLPKNYGRRKLPANCSAE